MSDCRARSVPPREEEMGSILQDSYRILQLEEENFTWAQLLNPSAVSLLWLLPDSCGVIPVLLQDVE